MFVCRHSRGLSRVRKRRMAAPLCNDGREPACRFGQNVEGRALSRRVIVLTPQRAFVQYDEPDNGLCARSRTRAAEARAGDLEVGFDPDFVEARLRRRCFKFAPIVCRRRASCRNKRQRRQQASGKMERSRMANGVAPGAMRMQHPAIHIAMPPAARLRTRAAPAENRRGVRRRQSGARERRT